MEQLPLKKTLRLVALVSALPLIGAIIYGLSVGSVDKAKIPVIIGILLASLTWSFLALKFKFIAITMAETRYTRLIMGQYPAPTWLAALFCVLYIMFGFIFIAAMYYI